MAKSSMKRFNTLTWNGPILPPEYKSTPNFKLHGFSVDPLCEEMFDKLAAYRFTDYWTNKYFQKNAWNSWKRTLPAQLQNSNFQTFEKDFEIRHDIQLKKKEAKAARSKDEREAEKIQRDIDKEKYGFALVDGEKTPIAGYLVEAPNFIIGRGDASFTGCWKARVQPEDITVNIVGDPMRTKELQRKGFKVVANNKVMYLFVYKMRLVGNSHTPVKKVNFAVSSKFAHGQEETKYEKTEELIEHWDEMTKTIDAAIASSDIKRRQVGACAYLVKNLGIRIGNERQEWEAPTYGASTLEVRHMKLNGTKLTLDFLGKDSVRFHNTVEISPNEAKALSEFVSGKNPKDRVFDKINSNTVSMLIKEVVSDISPKTFRSAQGCMTFIKSVKDFNIQKDWSDAKKKAALTRANLAAAIVLNHQKNVGKNYAEQENKSKERVEIASVKEKERKEKAAKQIAEYKKQLEVAKQLWTGEKLKSKVDLIKGRISKLKLSVSRAEERTENAKTSFEMKKDTKNVALGTSLSSYMSPKIIYSVCKDIQLPIERIYTKSLLLKTSWAENTPASYWKTLI